MSESDPSPQGTPRSWHDIERDEELARAAADLDALTDAYERSCQGLEAMEAMVDALLEDSGWCVLVVDHELRIRAISRGMAAQLGVDRTAVGRPVAQVVPQSWHLAQYLVDDLSHDGWHEVPLGHGAGRLHARRVSDRGAEPVYALRYTPAA